MRRFLAALAVVSVAFAGQPETAKPQDFQPAGWNEMRKENGNGTLTSQFSTKFVNYIEGEKWERINLVPKRELTGFRIAEAPYTALLPLKANGDIRFSSTNKYSVKEKRIRDDAPVSAVKRFTDAIPVDGQITPDGVLYAGALPKFGADLLLQPHEMELRYLVVWHAAPPQCATDASFEIPFTQTFEGGIVPRKNNRQRVRTTRESLKGGFSAEANSFRGVGTPVAHIWDSGRKRAEVEIKGRFTAPTLDAAKVIDCSFFQDAVYPVTTDATSTFYPNEDTEVSSFDAYIGNDNSNYDTAHNATSTTFDLSDSSTTLYVFSQGTWSIYRSILLFDTSSLTSGASISSAVLSVYHTGNNDPYSDSIRLTVSNPASNTAVTNTDYDQANFGTTAQAADIAKSSLVINTFADFVLNATGKANISLTSITKFGLRSVADVNSSHPSSANNYTAFSSADVAGLSQDPTLAITYTLGGTAVPIFMNIF